MRAFRLIATVGLIFAVVAPLAAQSPAARPAPSVAFLPARFVAIEEGTLGKPDVLLIPGMSSSRAVWEAESSMRASVRPALRPVLSIEAREE